jgi:rhodanese-related sulfurtransferase
MSEITNVTYDDAQVLIRDGALVLDVRDDHEWAGGRAPRARHIVLGDLPDHVGELPRNVTIVCVCRSGRRSARAAHFLDEQGLSVVNLEGGMVAWAASGGPLEGDYSVQEIV